MSMLSRLLHTPILFITLFQFFLAVLVGYAAGTSSSCLARVIDLDKKIIDLDKELSKLKNIDSSTHVVHAQPETVTAKADGNAISAPPPPS